MPFDSADNSTSPSLLLHPSPPIPFFSSLVLAYVVCWPPASPPQVLSSAPCSIQRPLSPCCHLLWRGSLHFLSRQSVVARGVYTKQTWNSNRGPCPTLAVSCSLYLLPPSLFAWADFLHMALVDNCHKLPSWFHFPLSSPKFLALAWDKGMSTSKGSAKSLTPKPKGTAHNTVIESSYWSQSCIERTAPVDTHTLLFMTAAEKASRSYNKPWLLRRPYNWVVKKTSQVI